jgi:hypothetical protein
MTSTPSTPQQNQQPQSSSFTQLFIHTNNNNHQHHYGIQEITLLTLGFAVILLDLWTRGIAEDVNGRLLSFLDSLAHCASWVAPVLSPTQPPPTEEPIGFWARLLGSIATKYSSGLIVSFFLKTTPTLLMGWENNMPFFIALILAHSFRFVPRVVRTRHGPWRVLFVLSGAVYKLRRLRFAMFRATNVFVALGLGLLVMELTGWLAILARRTARRQRLLVIHPFQQKRLLITPLVSLLCWYEFSPMVVLFLLVLHKALAPFNIETAILDPFDESDNVLMMTPNLSQAIRNNSLLITSPNGIKFLNRKHFFGSSNNNHLESPNNNNTNGNHTVGKVMNCEDTIGTKQSIPTDNSKEILHNNKKNE